MADEESQKSEVVADSNEARFSMRALLIVMAVVAVAASIFGAIVRRLDPATRLRVLGLWGVWLVAITAWIALMAYQRRAAEKLAGPPRLRFALYDDTIPDIGPFRRKWNFAIAVLVPLLFMIMISGGAAATKTGFAQIAIQFGFMGLVSAWMTARAVALLWWRNNVRFGEFGVLWDRRVMLWGHITATKWDAAGPNILEINGIDQRNVDMHLKVFIPPAERDGLSELLGAKVVQKPDVLIEGPMALLGRERLSVAIRNPRFYKYIAYIAAFMAIVICAPILFRGGLTGVREFDSTVWYGFIVGPFIALALRQRSKAPAGIPLVRLKARRNWLIVGVVAGALYGAYWAGKTYGVTSENTAYASGLSFGACASFGLGLLVPRNFDLRAHGVYKLGQFWPWSEVRVLHWDASTGKLKLGRGWRALSAKVPEKSREVVAQVLREKCAVGSEGTTQL